MDYFKCRTYVIVSKWAYPFGGGESFLYTTMKWAHEMKMYTYWLCFTNALGESFEEFEMINYPFGKILKIPDGFSEINLKNWLKILNPDYVHHQGHMRKNFFSPCEKLRVELLSGYHFWHGGIILDPEKKNISILENAEYHKTDPELKFLFERKYCNLYTVTPFVAECIEKISGYKITDHIYSSSSYNDYKIEGMDPSKNEFVTMINIHVLKGGEILLYLIKNCPNIPFLAVKTEYHSDDLDKQIYNAMENRINNGGKKCVFMERTDDVKSIYKQTKVLLAPSLCDETFCRVVNEGMMNNIPVMSTGQGNIKYLMGDSGYILPIDNKEIWKEKLFMLYSDPVIYAEQSKKSYENYINYSEKVAFRLFRDISKKVLMKSKEMNVMILSPWCDQGLGIQSRNYAKILEDTDYNVSIFAIKPYNANSCIELQRDPDEWLMENIYYSENDREHIADIEILNFIKKYNIGKCLLPETCWHRVFEIAKLLKNNMVKCYAIPNIEIVRKDEIFKHNYFYKILCNNYLCKSIFNNHGVMRTEYIGYSIPKNETNVRKQIGKNIKFLFIGGMNAFSRKHILDICQGFVEAYDVKKNISLTCTIQRTNMLEENDKDVIETYLNHPGINIIQDHLPYSKIIEMYNNHHISIQVSKHEGLGIGFYEALGTETPIITLNTAPHNEIVKDGINGWIIPCYYKPMTDNKDPIFESAYFNPGDLAKKILEIENDFNNKFIQIIKSLVDHFNKNLSLEIFKSRFIKSIQT